MRNYFEGFFACALVLAVSIFSHAATYYVSTTGIDSDSCVPNDETKAQRTVDAGISCLQGGDRLEIKKGTYLAPTAKVPSGSSTASTTITHYDKDIVTLTPAGSTCFLYGPCAIQRYVIVDGLIWDGIELGVIGQDHVKLINNEVKNNPHQGIEGYGGSFIEYINNKVHDNGTNPNLDHGIYLSGHNNVLEGNETYNNCAHGIVFYDGNYPQDIYDNVVRNNRIHDNDTCHTNSAGLNIYQGARTRAYNNLVYRNPHGIGTGGGATNTLIYNNTLYGNTYQGLYLTNATGTIAKNNIIYGNAGGPVSDTTGALLVNNLMTDPKFVNASAFDFHLQLTSPAINAGVTLNEVVCKFGEDAFGKDILKPCDFDKNLRPQGSAFDIGAYEYGGVSGTSKPKAPVGFVVR